MLSSTSFSQSSVMSAGANETLLPYVPGKPLRLQVLWGRRGMDLGQSVTATMSLPISISMSPVMAVTINRESGPPLQAMLKLYDRRFGWNLRRVGGEPMLHRPSDEAAFQSFIRQGKMTPFLHELEEDKKASLIPLSPSGYRDNTPDGSARFEAALWQECNAHFECETEAYARLSDLQGESIPRMYAHVRLVPSTSAVPEDLLQPQTARYFEIKGVLLERIPGYNMRKMATSPEALLDPSAWPGVVQSAVDAAHAINQRGVLMDDCAPRNVVVDRCSLTPFIIDLAQCSFKDKMVEAWEARGEDGEDEGEEGEEGEDWDPDVEYWHIAGTRDNPGAIGAVMARMLRKKGITLDIRYPDIDKLIGSIKHSKNMK